MEPWYKRRPTRYERELLAGRDLPLRLMRGRGGEVIWQGNVDVDGKAHYLHLQYPPDFPNRPPVVWETEAFREAVVNDIATSHQMMNGALCLYTVGRGPRSWNPDYTVADVLERYKEFRRMADAGEHRNEHGDDLAEVVGVPSPWKVVIPPSLADALGLPGVWGRLQLRRGHGVSLVVEAVWPEGLPDPIRTDVRAWIPKHAESQPAIEGRWFRAPSGSWRARTNELCKLTEPSRKGGEPPPAVQLFVRSPGGPDDALAVFPPRTAFNSQEAVTSSAARVVDLPAALFARVDGAVPDREKLSAATAVFVGLGSLGGSIAVHLARSGVGRFHLFDPEVLEPENVCRHVADLSALYFPKVQAVEAAIRQRSPRVEVQSVPASPLWDGPPLAAAALQSLLGRPSTILVVTTADDQVERSLNELAIQTGTPALYASVLGEASYGRVFRVLPGRTACYQCILNEQAAAPEAHPFLEVESGGVAPRFAGYRQPGIAGIGVDVEQVAVVAARLALQTLGAPLGLGYPDSHGDHFLLGFREGWVFDHPLQIARQHYSRHPECPVCSGSKPVVRKETAALENVLADPVRSWSGVRLLGEGR